MTYQRLVKRARSKSSLTRKGLYSTTTIKAPTFPNSTAPIKALPRDLLVEVVATLASQSFIDLHTIKICCKGFLDATEDSYVFQRVSLDLFPLIHWPANDKTSWFLNQCRECGNIESLYREGLRVYFNYPHGKFDGLEKLKVAAQKGHREAKYMYSMILLCSKDEELRKQGLELVRTLLTSKCVVSSRNKVKRLLDNMWKKSAPLERNRSPLCQFKSTCKGWGMKTGRWALLDDEDYDISFCEHCRLDHELEVFCMLLNVP